MSESFQFSKGVRKMNSTSNLNFNPWGKIGDDGLDVMTEDSQTVPELYEQYEQYEEQPEQEELPMEKPEDDSSPQSNSSTIIYVEQQQELLKQQLNIEPDEQVQESTTFFQGFRAANPRMSMNFHKPQPLKPVIPVPVVEKRRDSIASTLSQNSTNSKSSRLPAKARHQAIAINNIAKLFNELLNERDKLLTESDTLEVDRQTAEDELRQVEDILTKFNERKKELTKEINRIIKREDRIAQLLENVDDRINTIGDHTVKVEKQVRSIKGEPCMIEDDEESEEPNTCIKTYFGHMDTIECLDFESPFGHLVTGSADKTLRVWDMSSHKCLGVLEGHTGWVRTVQMSGYTVMSGSGDHTVNMWDISGLDTNPATQLVDAGDDDYTPLVKTFSGHTGGISCLQFNDTTLLTGSIDKTICQWDIETGSTLAVLRSEVSVDTLDNPLDQALYANEVASPAILVAEQTGWDDFDKPVEKVQKKIYNIGGHVGGLHFWQHALAAGYGDGVIRLFDLRSGSCHRELKGHFGAVTTVNFDDNVIISGSMDKTIKLWDLRMGDYTHSLNTAGNITDLSFDFSRIAIACSTKSINVYHRTSGNVVELEGHSKSVRTVKLKGGRIVSGGMDSTIRVWRSDPMQIIV
ncbi:Mitochondrial fission protein [Boothiomyces sp. JEL0838]|nr:Mitochondrial fission protein [Boothiomyces sp. JEL0838]